MNKKHHNWNTTIGTPQLGSRTIGALNCDFSIQDPNDAPQKNPIF